MRRIPPFHAYGTLRLSKPMQELARRIAEADGVVPLNDGEHRPPGYYLYGFFTRGRKPLPRPTTEAPRDDP